MLEADGQVQRIRPILPLRPVYGREGLDRDPRHAQRVGDDGAVQGFAEQDVATGDGRGNGERVPARVDHGDAAGSGGRVPRPAGRAFEVRHEADARRFQRRDQAGLGQQRCRIAQAEAFRKMKALGGTGAANPADVPFSVEFRGLLVSAIPRPRDQFQTHSCVPPVQHGADAEEPLRRVVIEEPGQKRGPQDGVKFVPEIAGRALPAIQHHDVSAAFRNPAA
jgi:hypothetical protein